MGTFKQRWGITSNGQMVVIFVVFAINGTLSAEISKLLMGGLGWTKETLPAYTFYPILLLLVFPLYPFLLMLIGTIFGQKRFFVPFAQKMIRGMGIGFLLPKKKRPDGR